MASERTSPRQQARRGHGFTLAELVLGMAITAMIALSIAGVAMALSTAGEQATEFYDSTQTARVASRNIESVFRKALLVTAIDANSVVLWAQDTNGNGDINITEVVLIRYDASAKVLRKYQIAFPDSWSQFLVNLLNYEVNLWTLTDAQSAAGWITSHYGYTQVTVLAENVSDMRISVSPAPPFTNVISMALAVGAGDLEVPLRATGHLRQCQSGRVGVNSNGYYVLNP